MTNAAITGQSVHQNASGITLDQILSIHSLAYDQCLPLRTSRQHNFAKLPWNPVHFVNPKDFLYKCER